jgi:hypothetical protein
MMSPVFRRYRQVKVVRHSSDSHPQVQGFEEVNVNGKRQVRYFNDLSDAGVRRGNTSWGWLNPLWDEALFLPFEELKSDNFSSDSPTFKHGMPRSINKQAVVVNDQSYQSQGGSKPFKLARQWLREKLHKLQKMGRNVPHALRAAWHTLNQ